MSGKQADENIGLREERIELRAAGEDRYPRRLFRGPAPARDLEAEMPELLAGIAAHDAESQDADAERARGVGGERIPDLLPLIVVDALLLPMVHQHMHDDIFAHPHGEIGLHHPHERHVRQGRIGEDRIDAGAQRKDRLEIGQRAERVGGGSQATA